MIFFSLFSFLTRCYRLFCNYIKMKNREEEEEEKQTVRLITVFSLGDEHPVTVQPYAVSLKLYFRTEWIVDPKCY